MIESNLSTPKKETFEEGIDLYTSVANEAANEKYNFQFFSLNLLGFSENVTFLITDKEDNKKYILRVCQPGYHTIEELQAEVKWVKIIQKESDIIVPDVLSGSDEKYVQIIRKNSKEYHCMLFKFITGKMPADDPLILNQVFKKVGKITAKLHNISEKYLCDNVPFERATWDIEKMFGTNAVWGHWTDNKFLSPDDLKILEHALEIIKYRLKLYGRNNKNFGLIHADLRITNVLKNSEIVKVIDFDDCGYSWYLYDLSASLTFLENRPYVQDLIKSWIEGYSSCRILSKDDLDEIETFIVMRSLLFISWIGTHGHSEEVKKIGEAYTYEAIDRAKTFIAHNRQI